jgi:hypothetical protein
MMPKVPRTLATWRWVMTFPRLYSAHGRSGSALRLVTRSTERITSSLPNASRQCRLARQLRPLAACEIGNGQEGPPVVVGAVVERLGYLRVRVGELLEVVGGPAGGLAAQGSKPFVVPLAQALDRRARWLALQLHDNGPAFEGVGQTPDRGNRLRCPD